MDVALQAASERAADRRKIEAEEEVIASVMRRLSTPVATLRQDFTFRAGLQPVMVFDCDEASFGYEDASGEWIEANEWPFNEQYVWPDDCERFGIRVE